MDCEVVYMVNGDSTYVEMTKTSIHLLRQHNREIAVRVFLINDSRHSQPVDLLDFCAAWDVAVVQRPNLSGTYFQDNKVHLAECRAERVLLLDADTFVFADLRPLFERYAESDVVACSNDWVWERGYPADAIPAASAPLNSGVVLCTGRFLADWTGRMPALHAALCEGTRYPLLSQWLYRVSQTAYNREELGLTLVTAEGDYKVNYFREEDCKLLKFKRLKQDMADFRSCTRVFHSYSQHWRACLRHL